MTARSPSAYAVSASLHGAVAALLLLLGYFANNSASDSPKVLELVAGEGDNYGATAAPALGSPDGIKVNLPGPLPAALSSPPPPAPAAPAPEPIQPAPLAPAARARVVKLAPQRKTETVPNFARIVRHTAARRAARLEAKYRKQLEAEERRRLSYAEFEKEHGGAAGSRPARVDAEGISRGVVGGSTANKEGGAGGQALTREEGELLDAYFSLLKARVHENYDPTAANGDRLSASIEFYIAADGSLGPPKIVRSSGNPDFDQAVLEAFRRTSPIGPRPDHHGETVRMEFNLRDEDDGQ